jgi:hypothetical protein
MWSLKTVPKVEALGGVHDFVEVHLMLELIIGNPDY